MRVWITDNALIENLSEQRSVWARRGVDLAHKTRDRGVSALERVRSGTLDWQATLEARRAELRDAAPDWFRFRGLQIFVVDRAETALVGFGERLRAHMQRLGQLELAAAAPAGSPPATPKKRPAAPTRKPAAKRPAARAKSPKATKAPAKSKPPRAKRETVSTKRAKSTRFLLPIADYDGLNAKQAIAEIGDLSAAQRKQIEAHERAHKNRKTVLAALAR